MGKLILTNSRALHYFKDLIGQNNHFLITILVGLDEVAAEKATLGSEFSTSWNPKDTRNSAMRSRQFAIKATLSWIVDSIDAYFTLAYRVPKLVQSEAFSESMDGTNQSVSNKLEVFRKHINCLDVEYALVKLMIVWRNRLVHNFAENDITEEIRKILSTEANKKYIKENYRNLEIDKLLESFDNSFKSIPKFKEITSFVSAAVKFITDVDDKLVSSLDLEKYFKEIIYNYILGDPNMQTPNDKDSRLKRLQGIWNKNDEIKKKKLVNIFAQYGCLIPDDYQLIEELSNKSFKEAKSFFELTR